MNAWSHLPNAHHIVWVIKSVKDNPEVWAVAWHAASDAIHDLTRDAAWEKAWDTAHDAARRESAWHAARHKVRYAARNTARASALDAVAALLAWDDSAQFLEMDGDELEVWARLSEDPRAILLLPAVRAFERIKALEAV